MEPDKTLTVSTLAAYFDPTLLKAYASLPDFEGLCKEAQTHHFYMVAVNPAQVALCKELLKGSPVRVGASVGFPLGQSTVRTKVFEAVDAIENGANEIDYMINLSELKNRNWPLVEREMEEIVTACRERNAVSKVIFETCYLEKQEIDTLCGIAVRVKPDFIKTSTGFGTGGALLEDVIRMKQNVGDDVKVKAAGGIRTLHTTLAMITAGADRIGSSASVRIMQEYAARLENGEL
ncbi:MAG: deoxyribose-phosphate aldolase [Oscillospiraceae bacterium]|nr:deoxyribose-phosphate aldolase [Oscillospiraceae bacterium]